MAVTISGSGTIDVGGTSTSQGTVRLYEDTDNGTNYVELVAPASVASNVTLTMPTTTGTVATVAGSDTQVIFNDGGSAYGGDSGLTYNKTTDTLTTSVVVHGAGSASAPSITFTGDTNTGVFFPAADTVGVATGGSERMRIDSLGNVGIGVTPSVWYTTGGYHALQVGNTSLFGRDGTNSELYINANAYDNSSGNATYISSDYASRYNQNDGAHAWFTAPSGTAGSTITFTERMRITSDGYLLVGYTSSNGAYKLQVNSQIFATSATIATSDGRYKENVTPLTGALDIVKALNPVQFEWKQHPVHNFDRSCPTVGFIAQEVQQVLADKPYLNSIIKANECTIQEEVKDEEGNVVTPAVKEDFYGIAEGNMIAILTKALQEAIGEIETLKTKVAALEAK